MRYFLNAHRDKINYLFVGVWNTIFGYCFFALLYILFSAKIHYLILFIISNIFSITNAYVGYKLFVFKTKGNIIREYSRFYLIYGFSIIINIICLPLLVEVLRINPLAAQAIILIFNVIISFTGHKHFTFGGQKC